MLNIDMAVKVKVERARFSHGEKGLDVDSEFVAYCEVCEREVALEEAKWVAVDDEGWHVPVCPACAEDCVLTNV